MKKSSKQKLIDFPVLCLVFCSFFFFNGFCSVSWLIFLPLCYHFTFLLFILIHYLYFLVFTNFISFFLFCIAHLSHCSYFAYTCTSVHSPLFFILWCNKRVFDLYILTQHSFLALFHCHKAFSWKYVHANGRVCLGPCIDGWKKLFWDTWCSERKEVVRVYFIKAFCIFICKKNFFTSVLYFYQS